MLRKGILTLVISVLSIFTYSLYTSPSLAEGDELIENIEIRGTRRVPQDTVRFHIISQKNGRFDPAILRRDFKTVWAQGFFDDLSITLEQGKTGKIVIFWVKEKPLIRSITYKGLKSATNTEVLDKYKDKKVNLGIETPFDPNKISRAITVLSDLLAEKGRQYAEIKYEATDIPPNSKAVTFLINEGPKVKVEKINFHGNTVYSSKELRKSMKYIKQTSLISMFSGKSTFDRNKLEASLEMGVRAKYNEKGYIKLLIEDPKVDVRDVNSMSFFPIPFKSTKGKRVFIDIPLEEGKQYRVGEINFTGNNLFTKDQLVRVFGMQQGEVFNGELIRKGFENLKKIYGSRGYINWTPIPRQDYDEENHTVNIVFDFEEGNQYYLRRLEFVGNTTTRDKVIRREMLLTEGEIYNTQLFDISLLRLNQLGYFDVLKQEDAEVKPEPKPDPSDGKYYVDVTLKVKEKGKNSIGLSGGVSGIGGSFLGVNYSTNNLMGYGETLDVQLQGGTRYSAYVLSFTEPYFRNRPLTTGFSVYYRKYSYREGDQFQGYYGYQPIGNELFSQNSRGFTLFGSKPVRPFTRFGLSYTMERTYTVFPSAQNQAFYTAFQFTDTFTGIGTYQGVLQSIISPTLTYSTVDNPYSPRSGKNVTFLLRMAGIGGDVRFIEPFVEAKYFRPMNKRRNTLGIRGLYSFITGYGGLQPPIYSRFYTGGEDSIRGFDFRTISPRAQVTTKTFVNGIVKDPYGNPVIDPQTGGATVQSVPFYTTFPYLVGGDSQVVFNIEYRIPIMGPVTMAPFLDIGKSWVARQSSLKLAPESAGNFYKFENGAFVPYTAGEPLPIIPVTTMWRASTGLEFQVILPVVNAPFRLIYFWDPLILNSFFIRPEGGLPYPLRDNYYSNDPTQKTRGFKFTVGRTF